MQNFQQFLLKVPNFILKSYVNPPEICSVNACIPNLNSSINFAKLFFLCRILVFSNFETLYNPSTYITNCDHRTLQSVDRQKKSVQFQWMHSERNLISLSIDFFLECALRKKCNWIKSISFQKHVYHGFKSICYRISNIFIDSWSIFL